MAEIKSNKAGYDITKSPVAPNLLFEVNTDPEGGVYVFTPIVTQRPDGYLLSWGNNAGLENPPTVLIANGVQGDQGERGPQGYTFTPAVSAVTGGKQISWSNDGQLPNPQTVTILDGAQGAPGVNGATFVPTIVAIQGGYRLSWSNDKELENPPTIDILNGANGQDGEGVPAGGTTGQILVKKSGQDYDTEWVTPEEPDPGTLDYNDLENKPSINGVQLSGNKTTGDLGINIPTKTSDLTNDSGYINSIPIATQNVLGGVKKGDRVTIAGDGTISADAQIVEVTSAQYEAMEQAGTLDPNVSYYISDADGGVQIPDIVATAFVDNTSGNPQVQVTRTGPPSAPSFEFDFTGLVGPAGTGLPGGTTDQVLAKASDNDNDLYWRTLGTAAAKDYTDLVRPDNHNLVESNAVYNAINSALSSIYTPRGDIACAELAPSLLVEANVGNVYETTDSGTTTAYFMQGAGIPIPAGQNIGIIKAGPNTYLFNMMSNSFDLSDYQKKDLSSPVASANTVEGALGAIQSEVEVLQGVKIKRKTVDIGGIAINQGGGSSGIYYKDNIDLGLTDSDLLVSVTWNGSWSEDVILVPNLRKLGLITRVSGKVLPTGRTVNAYYI